MIRAATIDDLEQLAVLYKELMIYHHKLDPEKYEIPDDRACEKKFRVYFDYCDDDRIPKLICHDTGGIIDGYALYMVCVLYDGNEKLFGTLSIEQIVVSESVRRKGIGSEIMRGLLKIASENDCDTLDIKVHANNDMAKQFYKKIGLVPKSINMEMRLN